MDGDLPKHASGPSSENLDHARASDEASESLRIFYSLLKKNRRSILASHFWTQQVRKIKVCRRISRRCPPIDADYAVVNTSRRLSPFVGFAFFASQRSQAACRFIQVVASTPRTASKRRAVSAVKPRFPPTNCEIRFVGTPIFRASSA